MAREGILQSKIQAPATPPQFILRERLLRRIDEAAGRLVVLSASVGYGKTVLLSHYTDTAEHACAWCHLEATDNDCMAFMQLLGRAVARVRPDFRFDAERAAARPGGSAVRSGILAYAFAEALYLLEGCRLDIIVDDFQAIRNSAVLEILRTILETLPAGVRLILATKSAPPPFTARYLLQDEAVILGREELSFNRQETKETLADAVAPEALDRIAEEVFAQAEGWPAGVRFSAIYLKQHGGVSKPAAIYNKSIVFDYIVHELYRETPYELQMFLAKTSVLDILSGDICDAVTGRTDSQGMLQYLEHENLFILRMGERRFRYHTIFREFLNQQLRRDDRRKALEKAARFYLKTSDKELAMEYALETGIPALCQEILESAGPQALERDRLETLDGWIGQLRDRSVPFTARNRLLCGRYAYRIGRTEQAMNEIAAAREMFRADGDETGCAEAMLQEARLLRQQDSLESSCSVLESAIRQARPKYGRLHANLILEELYNLVFQGRCREVLAVCGEMVLAARRTENRRMECRFLRFSVIPLFYLGEYAQALAAYQEAGDEGDDGEQAFSAGGYAALIHVFQGRSRKGRELADREAERRASHPCREDFWLVQLLRACTYLLPRRLGGEGDDILRDEGLQALAQAVELAGDGRANRFFSLYASRAGGALALCAGPYDGGAAAALLLEAQNFENAFLREAQMAAVAGTAFAAGDAELARKSAEACLERAQSESAFTLWARKILGDAALPENVRAYAGENDLRFYRLRAGSSAPQSSRRIHVTCFGSFAVCPPGSGDEVKWRTKKARELFAYLFHLQGKPVERDKLLCCLWPETAVENAVSLLHTTLYSIRRSLESHGLAALIEYRNKKYSIDMRLVDSDLAGLLEICAVLETGNRSAIYDKRELLLRCRGDYMGSLDYPWAVTQREYLESAVLKCCKAVAERSIEQGHFEQAIRYLKRCLEADPYAEAVYGLLLRCYGTLGDFGGVRRCHDRMEALFREELGVEPDARVEEIYRQWMERR